MMAESPKVITYLIYISAFLGVPASTGYTKYAVPKFISFIYLISNMSQRKRNSISL